MIDPCKSQHFRKGNSIVSSKAVWAVCISKQIPSHHRRLKGLTVVGWLGVMVHVFNVCIQEEEEFWSL